MSLPTWAKAPDIGARKPILIGAPWAVVGGGAESGSDEDGEQDEGQDPCGDAGHADLLLRAPRTPRGANRMTPM